MKNKERSYFWPIQIILWVVMGVFLYRSFKTPLTIGVLNTISGIFGGLLVTSFYRWYLKTNANWLQFKRGKFIYFLFLYRIIVTTIWFCLITLLIVSVFSRYHLNLHPLTISFNIIILVWVLLYLGFNLIKHDHISEVEKWQLEAEMQKAKLSALKSQINPHFMFNALNNIRALILEDKEAARQMITRFSELLRYSLQYSESKEVTIAEELDMLIQYVELLKIQYEDKLDFQLIVDENLTNETIPPMILQLLVENAIKHGIAHSASGGKIIVEIKKQLHTLTLAVKNSGSLTTDNKLEDSLGVGIKNITERLRLLYGNKASLSINENAPFVSVVINIEKE